MADFGFKKHGYFKRKDCLKVQKHKNYPIPTENGGPRKLEKSRLRRTEVKNTPENIYYILVDNFFVRYKK